MAVMMAATTIALAPGARTSRPDVSAPWVDVSPPTMSPEVERVSQWNKMIRKIHVMLTLTDDWDGIGATAPSWSIVFSALELAYALRETSHYPAPTRVAPTPSGTVGLEWQQPSVYTEAEIVAQVGRSGCRSKTGSNRCTGPKTASRTRISSWAAHLFLPPRSGRSARMIPSRPTAH